VVTCTAVDTCAAVATKFWYASDGVGDTDNAPESVRWGFVQGSQGLVTGNETFANSVFDGFVSKGWNRLRHNRVFNGAESGIFVGRQYNGWNTTITERPWLLKEAGSPRNIMPVQQVFDTLVAVRILLRRCGGSRFAGAVGTKNHPGSKSATG